MWLVTLRFGSGFGVAGFRLFLLQSNPNLVNVMGLFVGRKKQTSCGAKILCPSFGVDLLHSAEKS